VLDLHPATGRDVRLAGTAISCARDEPIAVAGTNAGDLVQLSVADLAVQAVMNSGRSPVRGVATGPLGKRALSCSEDGRVGLWDLVAHRAMRCDDFVHTGGGRGAAFMANGTQGLTVGGDRVFLWEISSGKHLGTIISDAPLVAVAAWPGPCLAVGTAVGDFVVRDWGDLQKMPVRSFVPGECLLATSDDGHYVAAGKGAQLLLFGNGTAPPTPKDAGDGTHLNAVAMARDGRRAVSVTRDRQVRVWKFDDLDAESDALTLPAGQRVEALCFRKDGSGILAVTESGFVLGFDFED
jgi:WD40 repeat protein